MEYCADKYDPELTLKAEVAPQIHWLPKVLSG